MVKIFLNCIFFFLPVIVFAQDTSYLIQNDSLYQKISFTKKIGIARTTDREDSLLIIKSLQGKTVSYADTFISMRTVPDLLFFDQVVVGTAVVDSAGKDGLPEMRVIHSRVYLRTVTNYYCISGLAAMMIVLLFWFLYERKNYRNRVHMTGQKTVNVVMLSISTTVTVSLIAGYILLKMTGDYSILGGLSTNLLYAGVTALALAIAQFVIMVVVVQLLQNKYKVKKEDA